MANWYSVRLFIIVYAISFVGCAAVFETDPLAVSLKLDRAPVDVTVDINEESRIVNIKGVKKGSVAEIFFLEDDVSMKALNCSFSAPDFVKVFPNGVSIQGPLASASEEIRFFCATFNGELEFRVSLGGALFGLISGESGAVEGSPSIGGPKGEWYLYESSGLTLDGHTHIFMQNIYSSKLILVSKTVGDQLGNGSSSSPQFSGDGNKIVFNSNATNFPGANGLKQVYVKEVNNLSLEPVLVSGVDALTPGDFESTEARFSFDGLKVIFRSRSENFIGPLTTRQIFIKDLQNISAPPVMVSGIDANTAGTMNGCATAVLSPDGTKVAFTTESFVYPGANGSRQIYTKDLTDLSLPPELVSGLDSSVAGLGGDSKVPQYSPDSSKIVFVSSANNFIGAGAYSRIYMKDLTDLSQSPVLVSEGGIGGHGMASFSPDGKRVIYQSASLSYPEANGTGNQIYIKELSNLLLDPLLVSKLSGGEVGVGNSHSALFSSDGSKVIFQSRAENFPDSNGADQVYVKDLKDISLPLVRIKHVLARTGGAGPSVTGVFSPDGTKVAFSSSSSMSFLAVEPYSQIYIKDYNDLSLPPILVSGLGATEGGTGNSEDPSFSLDGTKVVFTSNAVNFGGSPSLRQVYVKDLTKPSLAPILISAIDFSSFGTKSSFSPSFSPDGNKIVFSSAANQFLYANGKKQIYLKDYTNRGLSPILISGMDAVSPGTGDSTAPLFSPDGTKIYFISESAEFGGGGGWGSNVYSKNLLDLSLPPVLISGLDATTIGWGSVGDFKISPDGRKIVFTSDSFDYPVNNWILEVYTKDLTDLSLPPVFVSGIDEVTPGGGFEACESPSFSPDGNYIVFSSTGLDPSINFGFRQVYVKNVNDLSARPVLISRYEDLSGFGSSSIPMFSPDGKTIIFQSTASNLPWANWSSQIYMRSWK